MIIADLYYLFKILTYAGLSSTVEVQAEECRILEYRIQCLNATLLGAGTYRMHHVMACLLTTPGKDDEAQWLERKIREANGGLDAFANWFDYNREFKTQTLSHQDLPPDQVVVEGKFKCYDLRCKHYVYGFETEDGLQRHLDLHYESSADSQSRSTSIIQKRASNMSLDDNSEIPGAQRIYPDYEMSASETERGSTLQSPFQGRASLKPLLDRPGHGHSYGAAQMHSPAAIKSSGPCLRCKVLKKRCDCMSPCKECPQQDVMAPDLWKALGCFHGPLADLSKKVIQSIEECLFNIQLQDRRELNFNVTYQTDSAVFWTAELDFLLTSEAFRTLDDSFWASPAIRNGDLVSSNFPARMPDKPDDRQHFEKYSAAIGVLKASSKEPEFQYTNSAFNPFTLLRLGERLSSQARDRRDWELYVLAKEFLVACVHFREEYWNLLGKCASPEQFAAANSPQNLPDIKTPLVSFLCAFDARFTNRKELTVDGWLGSFYALCVISIVKTILTDASQNTQILEKQATYAAQLTTIYKVLVSVFSWSAKVSNWCPKEFIELRDPLLYSWSSDSGLASQLVNPQMQDALRNTKKMVRQNQWSSIGVKHSKDFLLSLGSGKFLEHGFNGFMVQVFRHKTTERSHHAPPKALADALTPQFTPLRPRRQPSTTAMDIDYKDYKDYTINEPVNIIRPISQVPDQDPHSVSRPGSERRASISSRRGTLPELPPAHREYAQERMSMGPPDRDGPHYANIGGVGVAELPPPPPPQSYRPCPPPKNYHPRESNGPSEAIDENGYYSAPPRANTNVVGSAFTPISADTYDRDAAQRAKFQRRESRGDLGAYNRYEEPDRRENQRPDILNHRDNQYRQAPPNGTLPRPEPRWMPQQNYQEHAEADQTYAKPQGSYYQLASVPNSNEEHLYHKRRPSPPAPPATSNYPPRTGEGTYTEHPTHYSGSEDSRNGIAKGTLVFGINDTGVNSSRKPKRRELSKEQREQAAAVRRMGACPDCKARKIKVRFYRSYCYACL